MTTKKQTPTQIATQTKEEIIMDRNIKMPEAIWQRFQKGEVNLIDNLWDELGQMIRITNEMEVKKAREQGKSSAIKILKDWFGMPTNAQNKKFLCDYSDIEDLFKKLQEIK